MRALGFIMLTVGIAILLLGLAAAETHDYWNFYKCELTGAADSTWGLRAREARDEIGGYAYFEGTWTFWWKETAGDELIVTAVDLRDSSGTAVVRWAVVCTLIATTYGVQNLKGVLVGVDSIFLDARSIGEDVYTTVVGDMKDGTDELGGW